jgi:putative sterol carrier protein
MSDPKTTFETEIHNKIIADPEKAKLVGAIYLFKLTGDGGGDWTVNLKDDPGVKAGDSGNADCTFELRAEDWDELRARPEAGMQMYFQQRLKVTGNIMLATKLQQILNP